MILIYGIPSETPISLLTGELDKIGYPYLMVNQRKIHDTELTLNGSERKLKYGDLSFNISDFSGMYIRSMDPNRIPEVESADSNNILKKAIHLSRQFWFLTDIHPGLVVNRRRAMASNGSKPYQAQIISKSGLKVPDTIITNELDKVEAFRKKHLKIIYKSASGVRSIVNEFDPSLESRTSKIKNCPVQFQQYIQGQDIRVHVVGDKIFPTQISTTGIDYRYAHREENGNTVLETTTLPESIQEKCVLLARSLNLHFTGIDLRRSVDDEFYCFEANPSPAYSYYQNHTGQNIAEALALSFASYKH